MQSRGLKFYWAELSTLHTDPLPQKNQNFQHGLSNCCFWYWIKHLFTFLWSKLSRIRRQAGPPFWPCRLPLYTAWLTLLPNLAKFLFRKRDSVIWADWKTKKCTLIVTSEHVIHWPKLQLRFTQINMTQGGKQVKKFKENLIICPWRLNFRNRKP